VVVINHGRVVLDDKVSTVRRKFLSSKIIGARYEELPGEFNLKGVTVLKRSGYAIKLEVDTTLTNIDVVTAAILHAGRVADITIEDPPLEDVIAHIYGQQKDRCAPAAVPA
jgi:ABC-2 type transport system ATP-binding protein